MNTERGDIEDGKTYGCIARETIQKNEDAFDAAQLSKLLDNVKPYVKHVCKIEVDKGSCSILIFIDNSYLRIHWFDDQMEAEDGVIEFPPATKH